MHIISEANKRNKDASKVKSSTSKTKKANKTYTLGCASDDIVVTCKQWNIKLWDMNVKFAKLNLKYLMEWMNYYMIMKLVLNWMILSKQSLLMINEEEFSCYSGDFLSTQLTEEEAL